MRFAEQKPHPKASQTTGVADSHTYVPGVIKAEATQWMGIPKISARKTAGDPKRIPIQYFSRNTRAERGVRRERRGERGERTGNYCPDFLCKRIHLDTWTPHLKQRFDAAWQDFQAAPHDARTVSAMPRRSHMVSIEIITSLSKLDYQPMLDQLIVYH